MLEYFNNQAQPVASNVDISDHSVIAPDRTCWARLHIHRDSWASTSAKNPAYERLLYVDPLIGPQMVNTMPEVTIRDFDGRHRADRILMPLFGGTMMSLCVLP